MNTSGPRDFKTLREKAERRESPAIYQCKCAVSWIFDFVVGQAAVDSNKECAFALVPAVNVAGGSKAVAKAAAAAVRVLGGGATN